MQFKIKVPIKEIKIIEPIQTKNDVDISRYDKVKRVKYTKLNTEPINKEIYFDLLKH